MKGLMSFFQPLGRALMLPIAVLPIAGLLLRLGQPDIVATGLIGAGIASVLASAGSAVFDHLGLLFTIGVAAGFARDGNGAACLAGVTCYVIAGQGAQALLAVPPEIGAGLADDVKATVVTAWRAAAIHRLDVPLGIVSGLIGGHFYNRFSRIALPEYLAFFGGRRFVPIVSGFAGLFIGLLLGAALGPLNVALDVMSKSVIESGGIGLFAFGLLNRLLIVTGLDHILNNVAYFIVGDWQGTTGDLRRFFAGDPSAGVFMSGFFPVMMFGLPAACLAMYHEARPERRKAVGGMFLSMGLTSFLTGVTEPIEFSFMFLAPLLYLIHAILTGIAEVVMYVLGVRLGFTFSAGAIDYLLNFNKATRPWLLLPIGAAYAVIYYSIFRFAISRWNLQTPGRDLVESDQTELEETQSVAGEMDRGTAFVRALGGADNLVEIGACTTRLRLVVANQSKVNDAALSKLGAMGILRPSETTLQVVVGPIADAVVMDIQSALARTPHATPTPATVASVSRNEPKADAHLPAMLALMVGGADNIHSATLYQGRWRVEVLDPTLVVSELQSDTPARALTFVSPNVVHILI